jgi:4'-phosphopantetheinyl transferase
MMSEARETLARGAVHVWLAKPDAPPTRARIAGWRTLLAPDELAYAKQHKTPELRRRHLLGRAVLRLALSRYSAIAPRDWRFALERGGRPRVAGPGPAKLSFSLSSTPGLVAVAIARFPAVGLDLESTAAAIPSDLVERLLTPSEGRALRRLPQGQRMRRFYELWTLKEAYLKARGLGLAVPPWSFGFRLGNRIALESKGSDRPAGAWKFAILRPTPEHQVAVAAHPPRDAPLEVTARWWES